MGVDKPRSRYYYLFINKRNRWERRVGFNTTSQRVAVGGMRYGVFQLNGLLRATRTYSRRLTETITVNRMAYIVVYEKADNEVHSSVKLSGTADYIRLKYINTWDFLFVYSTGNYWGMAENNKGRNISRSVDGYINGEYTGFVDSVR